jgi:hypothetical protein
MIILGHSILQAPPQSKVFLDNITLFSEYGNGPDPTFLLLRLRNRLG